MRREDTRTTTPEDAAAFERIHGDWYGPDRPALADLLDDGPPTPLPHILDVVKSTLIGAHIDPRPLACADGTVAFMVRDDDPDHLTAILTTTPGLEAKVIDGTMYVRRYDPWRNQPINTPAEPPF